MGFRYSLSRSNIALSTSNDSLTIISAAARSLLITEVSVGGMGTASAANELGVFRCTAAGTTGGGALTAVKFNTNAPSPVFTNFTTWTGQPTVDAAGPVIRLPFNANGGTYRWVAPPGGGIEVPGNATATGYISLRGVVGTSNFSFHIVVEEI